jgi:ABC-type uncharacterized transport system permease subunit
MTFSILGSEPLFGFADTLQIRLQSLNMLPSQIILMIYYLLTIEILTGVVGNAVVPIDHKSYRKE